MEPYSVILIIGCALLFPCIIALFETHWKSLAEAFFRMLMSPIAVGEHSLQQFWGGVGQFYRNQFSDGKGAINLNIIFYRFIGSLLYTACFALFVFADFHLLLLTLAGMGLDVSQFEPPVGAGTLTVLALIAGILFFGTLLLDLIGMTDIVPWKDKLSPLWSKIMFNIALFSLLLSLAIAIFCGVWRGSSMIEKEISINDMQTLSSGGTIDLNSTMNIGQANSDTRLNKILLFVNLAIPALFLLGGIFSGYGAVELIKLVMLAIIFILLCPSGLLLIILAYTSRIIDRIYDLVLMMIQLLSAVGASLMGIFHYRLPDHENSTEPSKAEDNKNPSKADEIDSNMENTVDTGFNPY